MTHTDTDRDDAMPSIAQMLKSSDWDARLEEARRKREKILAARGKDDEEARRRKIAELQSRMRELRDPDAPVTPPAPPRHRTAATAPATPRNAPVQPPVTAPPAEAPPRAVFRYGPDRRRARSRWRIATTVLMTTGVLVTMALARDAQMPLPILSDSGPDRPVAARFVPAGAAPPAPVPAIARLAPGVQTPDRDPPRMTRSALSQPSATAAAPGALPGLTAPRSADGLGLIGPAELGRASLVLFYPEGETAGFARLADRLRDTGAAVAQAGPIRFAPETGAVRVYHAADLPAARAVAVLGGLNVQELLDYVPKPPEGQIDILLPRARS